MQSDPPDRHGEVAMMAVHHCDWIAISSRFSPARALHDRHFERKESVPSRFGMPLA
jgi:hypothetical protein